MKNKLLCYMLVQFTAPLLIAGQGEVREKLEIRLPQYTISERSRLWALLRIAKDFEVPLGIEWVHRTGPDEPVNYTWRDRSLMQIVTDLASAQGYRVEAQKDIVQVFPEDIAVAKWNFLNLVLGRFAADDEMLGMAQARLYNRLRRILNPSKVALPGAGTGGSVAIGAGGTRRVTLHLENASVREVLCRLVALAGGHSWVVVFPENPDIMQSGFARALQLYSLDLPADDRQPVFALVPWEFQPPSRWPQDVK